ncbi:MAG: hypothetical protein QM723_18855 [Myxococcaceae bacterium]
MTYLPGFKASCLTLCAIFVLLAGSILARGPMVAMADYQVPPETLASPHYADAMTWVFLHMLVLGLLIGTVGWFAEGVRLQRAFSRVMLAAQLVYATLDVRTADWRFGNALYKGPGSLGPVVVEALALVLWARLSFVRPKTHPTGK